MGCLAVITYHYLERRTGGRDLSESDNVAKVDGHRIETLCRHLDITSYENEEIHQESLHASSI